MSDHKQKYLLILTSYFLLANILVLLLRPNYFINLLIVYLPPSIMNFIWLKKSQKKILVFSLVTVLLFAPPVELTARLADVWDVASIFPRLFGTAPFENLFYAFINFFWPLSFYEYFIDKDTTKRPNKRFRYLILIYLLLSSSIYFLFFFNREIIAFNYLLIGVGVSIPMIFIFKHNPHLLPKTLLPTAYFAFIFFVHEMVSMYIGHWWWPGEFIYAFQVFGQPFPLEDIVIWYFLTTPALIAGYEFFVDDDN